MSTCESNMLSPRTLFLSLNVLLIVVGNNQGTHPDALPTESRTSISDNQPTDYNLDDDEFHQLMEILKYEADQAKISGDTRNYLRDDADMERILALIHENEADNPAEVSTGGSEVPTAAGQPGQSETITIDKNDENICPICLESMDFDRKSRLECGHVFHRICMLKWRQYSDNEDLCQCPMCKSYSCGW